MRALSLVLVAMEEDVPVGAMSMLEVAARDGLRVKPRATIQVTIISTTVVVVVVVAC
jgi:hypothetical protein